MKKILSMVTALCCTASLMAVLPAHAEEQAQTYIVIALEVPQTPETYLLSDTKGNTYTLPAASVAEFSDGAYFTVGDILEFKNLGYVSTCLEGTNSMSIEQNADSKEKGSVTKTGSLYEDAEISEFTVNITKEDYHKYYTLTNDTGTYNYWLDWVWASYWQPNMYPYDLLKDGNTYSFYTYEGQPIMIVSDGENASPIDFDIKTDNFFLVTGTKGKACMMNWCYYSGESGKYFYHDLISTTGDFEYGDILIYDGTYMILETYPCQLAGTGEGLKKVGTYKDFFTNKDLTVTEIETHQDDIDYVKIFKLSDSEGNEYNYSQDYAHVDYPVSMENAQVGDTYTFAFNGNYLLLPVAGDELTVNPVPTVTATGDADGSGELDILDIITVNKAILGKENLSEDRISFVDFNGNGVPDADDALTMLKMLVGLL